jgi:hypothetical protein
VDIRGTTNGGTIVDTRNFAPGIFTITATDSDRRWSTTFLNILE